MSMNAYNITYTVPGSTTTGFITLVKHCAPPPTLLVAHLQDNFPGVDFKVEAAAAVIDAQRLGFYDSALAVKDQVTRLLQEAGHLEDPRLKVLEGRRSELREIRIILEHRPPAIDMTGESVVDCIQTIASRLQKIIAMPTWRSDLDALAQMVQELTVTPNYVSVRLDELQKDVDKEEKRLIEEIEEYKRQKKKGRQP